MGQRISATDHVTPLLGSCEYRVGSEARTVNLVLWFFILECTSGPFEICGGVMKLL